MFIRVSPSSRRRGASDPDALTAQYLVRVVGRRNAPGLLPCSSRSSLAPFGPRPWTDVLHFAWSRGHRAAAPQGRLIEGDRIELGYIILPKDVTRSAFLFANWSDEDLAIADELAAMYAPLVKPKWKEIETTFMPYFAWSNRGVAEMTVWMPIVWN